VASANGNRSAGLERALGLLRPRHRDAGVVVPRGYLDLIGTSAPESTGFTQDLMLTGVVPRIYERWWRPALGRVAKGVMGPGMEDEHRIARLLLGLSPGDGVLDVACGTGNFTRRFARTVGEYGLAVGIDLSETMLTRAVDDTRDAGLSDQTAYVRGSVEDMPFLGHSFDAVCCFAALHLFENPMTALDGMTEVLTPGGRIAIFTSVRGRSAPLRTWESIAGGRSGMKLFERDEVVRALESRGFTDVRQRITGITQFVGGRLGGT
jgi:SAM-dependent methyltransferase